MLTQSDYCHVVYVSLSTLFIYINHIFFILFINSKPQGRKTVLGKIYLDIATFCICFVIHI
jgi:hypothetical protein